MLKRLVVFALCLAAAESFSLPSVLAPSRKDAASLQATTPPVLSRRCRPGPRSLSSLDCGKRIENSLCVGSLVQGGPLGTSAPFFHGCKVATNARQER